MENKTTSPSDEGWNTTFGYWAMYPEKYKSHREKSC